MKKQQKHTEDSVKSGLKIESGKTGSSKIPDETRLEKDPDEVSHEMLEEQPNLIPTEQDIDDLMHSQPPQHDYDLDKEQDIDDLLHDPPEAEDDLP